MKKIENKHICGTGGKEIVYFYWAVTFTVYSCPVKCYLCSWCFLSTIKTDDQGQNLKCTHLGAGSKTGQTLLNFSGLVRIRKLLVCSGIYLLKWEEVNRPRVSGLKKHCKGVVKTSPRPCSVYADSWETTTVDRTCWQAAVNDDTAQPRRKQDLIWADQAERRPKDVRGVVSAPQGIDTGGCPCCLCAWPRCGSRMILPTFSGILLCGPRLFLFTSSLIT